APAAGIPRGHRAPRSRQGGRAPHRAHVCRGEAAVVPPDEARRTGTRGPRRPGLAHRRARRPALPRRDHGVRDRRAGGALLARRPARYTRTMLFDDLTGAEVEAFRRELAKDMAEAVGVVATVDDPAEVELCGFELATSLALAPPQIVAEALGMIA